MTQEEKARAYDEALERAKEIKSKILCSHLSTESCKAVSEYIDTIIPELMESEDERIRKALIQFLTDIKGISESGRTTWAVRKEDAEMCKRFLTYLEKQKECVADSSKTSADEEERIRTEIISALEFANDGGIYDKHIAYLEKQKEQKLAWSEEEVLNRTYEEGFNDGLKYRKPVKRSDEDKKMSDWLIGLVNANTELSFKDKVTLTRWLEHLTIEKELSKNDKRIIDAIMIGYQDKDFHSSQIPTPIGVSKDEVIDWLKSLRPSWKPSEE